MRMNLEENIVQFIFIYNIRKMALYHPRYFFIRESMKTKVAHKSSDDFMLHQKHNSHNINYKKN